ncbi:MAG: AraC family transcriptional regulator [Clostridia bacterium]|nr:AraC family transcriptional regulator [Clostridia bacterium]
MFYEPEHGSIAFAARAEYRKGTVTFSPHRHNQLELIFVVSGEYRFTAGEETEIFLPGDVYLVNGRETHSGEVVQPGYYYYVQLSLRQTPAGLSEELDRLVEGLEKHRIRLPMRIPADQAEETGLFARGMELVDCFSPKSGYNEFKVLLKSLAIFQVISEHRLFHTVQTREQAEGPFDRQVAEFVEQHYTEDLRLETVAAAFGYEPHYFCSLFKRKFLVSFTHYLRVVRVQKFLSHPNLNLQTIAKCAAEVGFSNYSYFYQSFRRVRGCSPREFLTKTRK